jgi:hypothetical protein
MKFSKSDTPTFLRIIKINKLAEESMHKDKIISLVNKKNKIKQWQ